MINGAANKSIVSIAKHNMSGNNLCIRMTDREVYEVARKELIKIPSDILFEALLS